jgi:hypothetical protein
MTKPVNVEYLQQRVTDLEAKIERLQNHLDGVDAILGGNTVVSVNGEIRGQEWRVRKLDELKARLVRVPTTVPCPYSPCCGCLTVLLKWNYIILRCNECSNEAGRGNYE